MSSPGPRAGPRLAGRGASRQAPRRGVRVVSGVALGSPQGSGAPRVPVARTSGWGGTGLPRVDSAVPVGLVKLGHVPRRLLEELSPDLPPAGAI